MYCEFVIASYEALQSLWDCLQVLVLVIVKLDISYVLNWTELRIFGISRNYSNCGAETLRGIEFLVKSLSFRAHMQAGNRSISGLLCTKRKDTCISWK